jgi:tetratricopeptide (TPR) repeat protein
MLAKRIWRVHNIFITGGATMTNALAELESARRALPNDPRIFELTGYILRRRCQQEEGLRNLQRAVELDPRNFDTLQQIAVSYQSLGRYAEAIAALDRALRIMPDNVETRASRALFELWWKGDTQPLHQTIDTILAQGPSAIASAADLWFAARWPNAIRLQLSQRSSRWATIPLGAKGQYVEAAALGKGCWRG